MEKRAMLLLKTASVMRDPRVPAYVKQVAYEYCKTAGLFDSAMNTLPGIGGSIADAGSSLFSGASNAIGSIGNSLAPMISSGISAMLPTGVTWENIADVLKRSDPEIASMASDPNFMDALKQAVSESGDINSVLAALGLK